MTTPAQRLMRDSMHPRHLPAEHPTVPRPDDPAASELDAVDALCRALNLGAVDTPEPIFRIEPLAAAEAASPPKTSASVRDEGSDKAAHPPQDLGDLRVVDVRAMRPNPRLRRLATSSAAAKAKLRDSLGAMGLRSPLLVRPVDGGFEIVRGHDRYVEIIGLGWQTVQVRVQNMTGVEAAIHALAGEYHTRRCMYDKYRLIAAVRDQVALQKRVEPGQISNREVHHLTRFEESDVSEALAAVDGVARLAGRAGVEPDDARLTRITRQQFRDMKGAGSDDERAKMLREAVEAPGARRGDMPERSLSETVVVTVGKNGEGFVRIAGLADCSDAQLAHALRHIAVKLRGVHRDMRARESRSGSGGKS